MSSRPGDGTAARVLRRQAAEQIELCRKVRASYPVTDTSAGARPRFRRVIAIVASSRGGSSLLFELLRSTRAFLCLDGEHSTLYKLNQLGLPASYEAHDGSTARSGDVDGFLADLRQEVSTASAPLRAIAPHQDQVRLFAHRIAWKLVQQWPDNALGMDRTVAVVHNVVADSMRTGIWDTRRILLRVIRRLRALGWDLNPWYYDINQTLIAAEFPEIPPADGPPRSLVDSLEAPPFIVPSPCAQRGEEDLERPLLLKASMDAYRIRFLRDQVFPHSELSFIHLTRNPAAAINGLRDGWLGRGFFSHNLGNRARLEIGGYTARGWWGSAWWNFDLPPGWRDLVDQPLSRVCAAQWVMAHTSILTSIDETRARVLRLRAEDIMNNATRQKAVAHVLRYCDVMPGALARSGIVMATEPPAPNRWRRRVEFIAPALSGAAVRECSDQLGYGKHVSGDWT